MSSVKPVYPTGEQHVALLMGLLFREVSDTFAAEDWSGLRQSHFRVLAAVSGGGLTITELAGRLGMTKQGCGQLVATLTASGHLAVEPGEHDRRVRLVQRTTLGEETSAAVTARIRRLEDDWATRVGRDRYATFRRVLEELVRPAPEAPEDR
ncbi:DNA-binding transcriptional regulator, MarR family [Nocardioides scoriae]|uniref:DNA-binding transcriptional regulator, MarR family n=1 Tax=Nocardioides scoriae TaxID=642780 RepID=A0A1H1MTW9_9ACTN|nr:helix-turn-helix domain-containing protein [Nocardioides scoriae]SDR90032.1 DNA-binding transcriptional regulator, MarR family [Nocardioides scoriae]